MLEATARTELLIRGLRPFLSPRAPLEIITTGIAQKSDVEDKTDNSKAWFTLLRKRDKCEEKFMS